MFENGFPKKLKSGTHESLADIHKYLSVRNYCVQERVNGVFLTGKTWKIPEKAKKLERSNKRKEQRILQEEKKSKYPGGIYHKTQIDLAYNSNHMERNRLTHDQPRHIFEINTIR